MKTPMKTPMIIGIAGPSGSGKSLLASTIVNELGSCKVAVISEDSYYKDLRGLSLEERAKSNFDHPDAFEHALLAEHLQALIRGESIQVPMYDHNQHKRLDETHELSDCTIVVVEGILIFLEQSLRDVMDIQIFVDTPLDVCLIRRLERDISERSRTVECILKQYQSFVRPMYLQFVEPSKRYADIIVPHGGKNRIAIDLIKAKMSEMLAYA